MDTAAETAGIELFAASGVKVTAVSGPAVPLPIPDLAALGTVRFTASALRGTAVLGVSTPTLRRSSTGSTSTIDWIAELANQYVGRFKLKLLRAGLELWSMEPGRVSGRLLATGVSQPEFSPFFFRDAKGGSVAVWMEIEITGSLKSAPPGAGEGEIPHEGDLILF